MVDDNIVDEGNGHGEIGLWGLILILLTKMRGGGKKSIDRVYLFIYVNEAMAWVLGESVGKDEYEGVRVQRESCGKY